MRSIQSRVTAAVIVSQLVMAVALASFGVWYTRHRLLGALDATLRARAMSVAALVRYPEDEGSPLVFDGQLAPQSLERRHPGPVPGKSRRTKCRGTIRRLPQ